MGYLGIEKDFLERLSALPYRKRTNQGLPEEEEKEHNKSHSRKKMVIEYTICQLKKYKIMSEIFRNILRKRNKVQI